MISRRSLPECELTPGAAARATIVARSHVSARRLVIKCAYELFWVIFAVGFMAGCGLALGFDFLIHFMGTQLNRSE